MKLTLIAPNSTSSLRFYDVVENFEVIFSPETLDVLARHRQIRATQPEAGGQLFAELQDNIVHIKHASEPKPKDRRSRFSFRPFRKDQQREIDQHFLKGLNFVGDWHTHPQSIPRPSGVDERSISECVKFSKHDLKGFLLVIVGQTAFPEGIYVGFADSNALRTLHLQTEAE